MRKIKLIITVATIVLISYLTGCSNDIPMKNRSIYEPGFFQTEQGIQYGLTSLFHTRYFLGQYYYAAQQNGTDNILMRKVPTITLKTQICRELDL